MNRDTLSQFSLLGKVKLCFLLRKLALRIADRLMLRPGRFHFNTVADLQA